MTLAPRNALPSAELRRLVDAIGEDATLLLVEHFGGANVYVAKTPGADSVLARVIGLEAARLLGSGPWGGERIKFPMARAWRVQVLHARGASTADIVRRVQVDRSTVQRIVLGRRDTKQLYLHFADE